MAGVIKSGQLHGKSNAAQVATFNFEDMARKADAYVETIHRQAARILADAKQRAAEMEDDARANGRLAALREAEQAARAELERRIESLVPALNLAIDSIRHARETSLQYWEQNTIRLASAIAARVIRRELSTNHEITLEWVREALELVTEEGLVTVRLNPRDFEALGESSRCLTERLSRRKGSQIVADPDIEPGGCRVDTEFGCIDQQISAHVPASEEDLAGSQ